MDLASKLFKGDRVIWVIFMFLCLVSVIEVFSATSTIAYKNANHWAPIVRHATFLLGGFVLVLLMHNIPCRFYSLLSLLLPVSMVLLAITPFVGVVVNGEPRWLEILGIRFQPSEIAKIAAIGYTAFILSKRNWFTDKQMFWYILGGVGGVCFLIFFNNGSTAILLFAVTFMMMFIGQISIGRLLRLGGAGIIGVLMLVGFIRFAPDKVIDLMPDRVHTWKARIERFPIRRMPSSLNREELSALTVTTIRWCMPRLHWHVAVCSGSSPDMGSNATFCRRLTRTLSMPLL